MSDVTKKTKMAICVHSLMLVAKLKKVRELAVYSSGNILAVRLVIR